ncbi:reductase [Bibersteinia trehalosi USDA-ARS-USMARC-188]|uniref:Reductase n=2 Tax=Bibersteinia trehalosi TaxID=47735 RepID=A0A4V7IAY4_BIBTR|nr:NrfD/PsrC family molybdoenzyme membrane anchor subunit [Bibersteinia trehalosi]AGH38068.1 reductase [Bibersteinia trehalosi USDA-ARS-USMARC-192]AHG82132.1 reductase [Bibersteinia trehalosi USDA-ARS-USMARC-188]AHG84441.1 reductase [Bibersteinia trehalosi USDA-ARS-USMARC-189]
MIREVLVEPQHIVWLPWIVHYFFFVGVAATAVFTAVLFAKKQRQNACVLNVGSANGPKGASEQCSRVKPTACELAAVTVALIGSIVAPVALTADLHQPSRILHFYTDFAWWSPMAWGAMILPLFSVAVAGYFVLALAHHTQPNLPKWLAWLQFPILKNQDLLWAFRLFAALTAVGIIGYTVLETYQTGTRILWHSAWLLPIMLFSAWAVALGLTQVISQFLLPLAGEVPEQPSGAGGKICLILTALSIIGLAFSSETAQRDFALLFNGSITAYLVGIFWLIALVCNFSAKNHRLQWLGVLALIAFGWLLRWVLVIQVQTIAKTNALQNPYHFDWTAVDGGLGIVSILGLAVLVTVGVGQIISLTT